MRQQLEIKFSCKVCKEDFVEQYLQLYLYLKSNLFIKIQRNSYVNFARKILLDNTDNYSYIQMQIHVSLYYKPRFMMQSGLCYIETFLSLKIRGL